jgi:hypothetical protein
MDLLPKIAHAANGADAVNSIVQKITNAIILPLVSLVFLAAFLYFVYGVVKFLINTDDPEKRAQGKQHILWATIGLAIMMSVYGIIRFVAQTVGQGGNIGF